jgi:hypothetical protein
VKKYIVILFLSLLSSFASATPSYLYYTGNGYVAGGKTDTISSLDGFDFSVNSFGANALSIYINDFATNPDFQTTQFFLVMLSAPSGLDLQVGTYADATRAPFQEFGSPGLWFAGNGRGSNQITGGFRILDIAFQNNTLSTLAVDFMQNEENGYLGQTYGSLRYQSAIPLTTIPEPSTLALLCIAFGAVVAYRRKQSRLQSSGAMSA